MPGAANVLNTVMPAMLLPSLKLQTAPASGPMLDVPVNWPVTPAAAVYGPLVLTYGAWAPAPFTLKPAAATAATSTARAMTLRDTGVMRMVDELPRGDEPSIPAATGRPP